LFTTNIYDMDWFGWGDLIYLPCALSSLAQAFFMFSPKLNDDDNSVFYLTSNYREIIKK